jgi:hypothetical protein
VSRKIVEESTALETLRKELEDSEGAWERAEKLVAARESGYERVFDAILNEEKVLNDLYAPPDRVASRLQDDFRLRPY